MTTKLRHRVSAAATAAILATLLVPAAQVGAQTPTCSNRQASSGVTTTFDSSSNVTRITGTSGADVIVGTPGRDVIRGLQGDDIICGFDGNDLIYGGNGADRILGGAGADSVFGGNGADTIFAGAGSDTVHGEGHSDTIVGGNGNDRLNGNIGHDVISGSNGHDTINGHFGNDTLRGNQGRDNINGGGRDDLIDGGPDADTITGNVGTDTCINRETIDTVRNCESNGGTVTTNPSTLGSSGVVCSQASLSAHYTSRIGTESTTLANAEQRLLAMINETREVCDLEPLRIHAPADVQAQAHSQDMLNGNFFRHSTRWRDLIGTNGVSAAGENIAFISPSTDPTIIHRNLIDSGGHLCNILSPRYDGVGLGFTHYDASSNRGLLVTEIFTGDGNFESTTGSLTVLDDIDNPRSERINCWG